MVVSSVINPAYTTQVQRSTPVSALLLPRSTPVSSLLISGSMVALLYRGLADYR